MALLCALSIIAAAAPSDAAKVTGLTVGGIYVAPGHGEVLFDIFNPTTKPIVVRYQILSANGAWDNTDYTQTIAPGAHQALSFYCDDTSYCGGVPVITPATVVPSLRWQPVTGGYDFIPAAGFRTMK